MVYLCKDCSYRGKMSGQGGECPACGSFNMVPCRSAAKDGTSTTAKWRIVIMLLLWGCLSALVISKLVP